MTNEQKENYNFAEREKVWQKFWDEENLYRFDRESTKPIFSVDTPPPYVSASHLHAGHVMSYTQAEFVVRYKRMRGFNVFYPMGFDDNGLPTERFVEKKYNVDKSKISKKEFVELCLKETKIGGETYRNFFQSLGISVDWSLLYSTINEHCQRIAQRSFIDLFNKSLVERREEPTIWCPFCQTALAQSDLEDLEESSVLNYINFKFEDGSLTTIATTRPELIPACVALFVNSKDERYAKFIGQKGIIPLFDLEVPIFADDRVDPNFGTGLMMVCTFGDVEDIVRWKDNSLQTRIAINSKGTMTEAAGKYKGMKIREAREAILSDLKAEGLLVKQEPITHVCNVHERCGTPAEFIITPQWFIKVVDFKSDWNKRGEELSWHPQFMKAKYDAWVEGLKWDWCISRQRYYGVPFPVWYCIECDNIILPSQEELPVDPTVTLPKEGKCPKCGSSEIKPEVDVMDTWMTSSLTPLINSYWGYPETVNLMDKIYPMTVRVQAFEIIRTWLFDTIVKSHFHTDSLPWKNVMISGWGLDEQGRKISKRLGNFIEPEILIEKYSADALRFWSAGANLGQNLRYNEEEVKVGKKTVTKLWNAARFAFMHLSDFKPDSQFDTSKLEGADLWILDELQKTLSEYEKGFDAYEYSRAKEAMSRFFWDKFSDNYIEFIKYRLYDENTEHMESREAARWTLYKVFLAILKMYAPIMPFVTEELYQKYFRKNENVISIHTSLLPETEEKFVSPEIESNFARVLAIVNEIRKYKALKNYSLKKEFAKLIIQSDNEELRSYFELLERVLSIGQIEFGEGEIEAGEGMKIGIVE